MRHTIRPSVCAPLLMTLAVLVASPTLAAAQSAKARVPAAPARSASKPPSVRPVFVRGRCEAGQVPKWDGRRWWCGDDLVGGGAGGGSSSGPAAPHLVDANDVGIGPLAGTLEREGLTIPQVLVTMPGDPRPLLLAVDETGFVAEGSLLVPTQGEAMTCVLGCGFDMQCSASCVTALPVCNPANAMLELPKPANRLFRPGAVVSAGPGTASLWAATSAVPSQVGECSTAGVPSCVTVVYQPASSSCATEFVIGSAVSRQGYPAAPLGDLHALFPPPYALKPR